MANLLSEIERTSRKHPYEAAIKHGETEITYKEMWEESGRFASALRKRGIKNDDRVAIYLPNTPRFITSFLGILGNASVVVPLNPQYKAREISHILSDSEAKAVVTLSENTEHVSNVREDTDIKYVITIDDETENSISYDSFLSSKSIGPKRRQNDDVAVQPYTSGTTGDPKGVLLTHRNLEFEAKATPEIHDGIDIDDKMFGALPLFHIYGLTVNMLATLYEGGSFHLLSKWSADAAFDVIEGDGITILHGVPAMFNDLVNHPDAEDHSLESVRFANAGGSSLPLDLIRRFEELFDVELLEGYGLTETAPTTHANRPGDRRKGSIGKTITGVNAKVVDDDFEEVPRIESGPVDSDTDLDDITGEIVINGPNVMKGYYGLPEANEDAFTVIEDVRWFHTGDIGYWDQDGFFYVVDREKHMIITGGYNVYPREVEELLFEHPDVADVAVVGIPDERRGETVKAYVKRQPGSDVSSEDLKQYCLDNLAEYKHPRVVEFVEDLPRTASGKVQKFKLRNS